jgi:glutamate---cysteine ligase / carboxylate-amine ligase
MKATGNSTENGECGDVQPFLHDYGSQRKTLTLGVEEEFFLVDMETGSPVGLAGEVSARVADQFGFGAAAEIYPSMIEIRTGVCKSLGQVREQLTGLRSATAAVAAEFGAGLLASSTYPPEHFREEMVRPIARYIRQLNDYRRLIVKQHITGCHIHVGISNPDNAIQVMNRARTMLSPLLALSANSPFWQGTNTGYESWRTLVWSRWPVSGIPPEFQGRADYDTLVADLIALGIIADASNLYWDLRPSLRWPTLEFRAFDVPRTVDVAVALSGLTRACARVCLDEAIRGVPATPVSPVILKAARWQAARDGLAGQLVHLPERRLAPASEIIHATLHRLRSELEDQGDWDEVSELVATILAEGNGAQRQRASYLRSGRTSQVVHDGLVPISAAIQERAAEVSGVS